MQNITSRSKILWITDTHMNNMFPWQRYAFIHQLEREEPKAIFLTGDISNGLFLTYDLKLLAKIGVPIYFVMGNHDRHWSSFEKITAKVRQLCQNFHNLIWMENQEVIELDEEIAVVGAEDWYSGDLGDTKWLKYTLDWLLIKEFRKMSNLEERIEAFRKLADQGVANIERKLDKALGLGYKTIYVLLHFPPWLEATRDEGTILGKFWLPYNTNIRMGKMIERVMEGNKKRRICVLTGHTHTPLYMRVSRSIDCQVGAGRYMGIPHSQKIYI